MQNDKLTWQTCLSLNQASSFYDWLTNAGSFMQRLEHHGIHQVNIDVLREDWSIPQPWESEILALKKNETALVREVRIFSNEAVWLYARTVFPSDILSGKEELSRLENRSLGSVLFTDSAIKRGKLEFVHARLSMLWPDFPCAHDDACHWIRRSLFTLNQHALLLTEILMPSLEELCLKK